MPPAHLQDVVEVLLVHAEEVAVVLPQDDGGCPGGIVDQCQLPEVIPLVQSGNQTLGVGNDQRVRQELRGH